MTGSVIRGRSRWLLAVVEVRHAVALILERSRRRGEILPAAVLARIGALVGKRLCVDLGVVELRRDERRGEPVHDELNAGYDVASVLRLEERPRFVRATGNLRRIDEARRADDIGRITVRRARARIGQAGKLRTEINEHGARSDV